MTPQQQVTIDDPRIRALAAAHPQVTVTMAIELATMLTAAEALGREAKVEDLGPEIRDRIRTARWEGEEETRKKYTEYLRALSWAKERLDQMIPWYLKAKEEAIAAGVDPGTL